MSRADRPNLCPCPCLNSHLQRRREKPHRYYLSAWFIASLKEKRVCDGILKRGCEEAPRNPWGALGSCYRAMSPVQEILRGKTHQWRNGNLFGALQVWDNLSSDLTQTHKWAGCVRWPVGLRACVSAIGLDQGKKGWCWGRNEPRGGCQLLHLSVFNNR